MLKRRYVATCQEMQGVSSAIAPSRPGVGRVDRPFCAAFRAAHAF